MQARSNTTIRKKEFCVSFDEASEILGYVLSKDLDDFLQEHGLIDEHNVPYKEELDRAIFRCRYFKKDPVYGGFYGNYYFITESGLKEIFNIALQRYLLEQPHQIMI